MQYSFQGLIFNVEGPQETYDSHHVHFSILDSSGTNILWECALQGLWEDDNIRATPDLLKVWEMHSEGDYFQETIKRHAPKGSTSYTAIFHEFLRAHFNELSFIKNLYSTSTLDWLSMGYKIYPEATKFWQKQVSAGLATYIEEEGRYKALLQTSNL